MSPRAVTIAAVLLLVHILGWVGCWMFTRKNFDLVPETYAPQIVHDAQNVTAARLTGSEPKKPQPKKPAGGRSVRVIEIDVLPEPVVCPATGEKIACKPVGLRIDIDDYGDHLSSSIVTEDGEILDAVEYPLSQYVKPAVRKNLLQAAVFSDGSKTATYSRKILGRAWVGGSVLLPNNEPAAAGITLGAEF